MVRPWSSVKLKQSDPFYQLPAWKKLRKWIKLRDKGLCQYSLRKGLLIEGNTADHILPKRFFPELALDENNILWCSESEHAKKRQIERQASNRVQAKELMIKHGYYLE